MYLLQYVNTVPLICLAALEMAKLLHVRSRIEEVLEPLFAEDGEIVEGGMFFFIVH